MRIVWCGLAIAFVFLGTLWAVDRQTRWDSPRLDPASFEVLREGGVRRARATVLVPIQPACPHCLESWRRMSTPCPGTPHCEELVALIVDVERRPDETTLSPLKADRIWWDRRGIWRRQWGHRLYGERMRFDASGRYVRTFPPPAP